VLAILVVTSVLASAPEAPRKSNVDVLILVLKPIAVPAEEVRVVDGLIAEAVGDVVANWRGTPPRVAVADDLRTLMNIHAEKEAAGCDDTACLAEIGGALGARYVLNGSVGTLGGSAVLQLSLFDVENSRSVERASATAPKVAELTPHIRGVVERVLAPLGAGLTRDEAPRASASASPLVLAGGLNAGAGALVAAGTGIAAVVLDELLAAGSAATPDEKREALSIGPPVVLAAGVAGAVAMVGLALTGVGLMSGGAG
jgi:hypothetical protein